MPSEPDDLPEQTGAPLTEPDDVAMIEPAAADDAALAGAIDVPVPEQAAAGAIEPVPVPLPTAQEIIDASPPAWAVDARMVKRLVMPESGEVALFVTHSATGAVKPHVLPHLRALAAEGIGVLLIVVADRPVVLPPELIEATAGLLVRRNQGYDFAAWAHAIKLNVALFGARMLYLVNDSVVGPAEGRLGAVIARVRESEADLIGLTESLEYRWHLQSYFLGVKPRLLASYAFQLFFGGVRLLPDKDLVIRAYELAFAGIMEEAGFAVEVLFPSTVAGNPTLGAWRELLDAGFPYAKLLLLRGAFPEHDSSGWREALAAAGFDLPLIETTLKVAREYLPADPDPRLLARPVAVEEPAGERLKIAFYGPWNYDNGLGHASRGIIAAIRRTGVQLNLHPIKQPFHVHRPLAPPVDIYEFQGQPDIAVVHLNPDSWHLLTEDQREHVRQAPRRIGYWVWEMGHLPAAWHLEFGSVDRIWSPSRYCAALFEGEGGAPVDVVPHAVPVLPAPEVDRAAVRARLGLAADRRIILYVFDGSSYLVRKNPAALVRAFAASGLAEDDWTLVLKTKHLMDRPEDGARFRALVDSVPEVVLLDQVMPAGELRALEAAADLYVSPHCSEGFGLTVAEAMAAGKPVIATDFGGTRDFLNAETGYPVRAHPWVLEDDFGHYAAGGAWARIDEPALTATLRRAAADVIAGDRSRGEAARARVGETLSYDAVADAVSASFARTMEAPPEEGKAGRASMLMQNAHPFEVIGLGDRVHRYVLRADGSPPDDALALANGLPADEDHWIAFAPAGSLTTPVFAELLLDASRARPDAAIFYADDVDRDAPHGIDQIRLKPEFDATLLAAEDYVGAPVIVRAAALRALGGLNPARRTAALADLLFRAQAAGLPVARMPIVLIAYPNGRVRPSEADYRAMLEAQPQLGDFRIADGRFAGSFQLQRRFGAAGKPPVTLVIPTRRTALPEGDGSYVERLLGDIARTDWPMDRLTVIVGDDIERAPAWASADHPFTLRRVETPRDPNEPFNYAAKMNRLWRAATTEQIVFLNDDLSMPDPAWLDALQTFALDEGVGGVGARLLFPDGRLQHAGMAPHQSAAAHLWIFRQAQRGTYQDWALVHREWSMVTGAVFATRRAVLEEVDGFDERFTLEFNDVDLCLRLRALGYRIVYTPFAELIHAEKASRGDAVPPGAELALFLQKWRGWLEQDPSWHPRLHGDKIEMTPQIDSRDWFY